MAEARAPQPSACGPHLVGPLLLEQGTPAQCDQHLEGIRSGAVQWCLALAEDTGAFDPDQVQTRAHWRENKRRRSRAGRSITERSGAE